MNHYPRHIGDYAKDTMGFSALDHGVYNLLLDAYYAAEEAPAADEVYAIAKAGTPAERKAVDKVLKKFRLSDGHYHHKRVEEELVAFRKRSADAAEKANLRWEKQRLKDAGGNATASSQHPPRHKPVHSPGNAQPMLASSHKPITTTPEEQRGTSDIEAPPERIAALIAICSANRVDTSYRRAQMGIRQFASEGVTDQQLNDAIAIARERIPDPGELRVAYLEPIVVDVRSGTARRPAQVVTREDFMTESMQRITAYEAREAAKAKEPQHGPN